MKCLDASFLVKFLIPEDSSEKVADLLNRWERERERLVAPYILFYEIASSLNRKMVRKIIPKSEAKQLLQDFRNIPIRYTFDYTLMDRAIFLALRYNQTTIYDCMYLAVAEKTKAELWTANQRFYQIIHKDFPIVRSIRE